ncbi:penicillin-binding protein 2 [Conexibacter arvalis]|uniref:Penicillin-binding protein 2 n=1 Tax=Conexibacter arvalis TaxID=912552 RepID=A0A840IIN2_9ACTN|nr:penicillin-binding protein 2 [Conexibacter arvalis]MBB4663810.1 penicillin-binding protein 2 [Conexibacter arvalis]
MIESPDDRRGQLSPQLAMRVAILGGIAFAIFGIIFFRLWFLQVLSGDQYLAEASSNRVRRVTIQAPRGEMIDRNGNVLVRNRSAVSIVASPTRLPDAEDPARERLFRRLSWVLGVSTRPRACRFGSGRTREVKRRMPLQCRVEQSIGALPYADVVVEPDASTAVYTYLAERAREFPGVETRTAWVREYPHRTVGAHLFGTVGQIDEEGLRNPKFRGVRGGTVVGKNGLEYVYDHYLRGQNGWQRIQVDAHGRATGRPLRSTEPVKGNDLKLSVDLDLLRVGQQALVNGKQLAQQNGNPANGGAFVAMNPDTGEVYAMGSDPSYDPSLFAQPIIPEREYNELRDDPDRPLFNRATQGTFAIGSTFKPVTIAAALAAGKTHVGEIWNDTGSWRSGAQVRYNAGRTIYGSVDLVDALSVSVDTFFYDLGARLNVDPSGNPHGGPLQEWARKFGFGAPTGVDIGNEAGGTIPDPDHIRELQDAERRCRRRDRRDNCYIADLNETWTVGDNVSFAIGQGDFLATPLQLATAYAAIRNGGTIVRPHLWMEALNAREEVVDRYTVKPGRRIEIPAIDTIREGLIKSTTDPRGTSTDVFAGFGKPVYGKTGTAEIVNRPDQSWYVAYVPDEQRPIVVAAVIQNGGFGAQAAAPAVRQILSQWFYGNPGRAVAGSSTTN